MYENKKIGVVVPAYNEEKFIEAVIQSMPAFVDRVFVVNDASTDSTLDIVFRVARQDPRLTVVNRSARRGVGAAVISGHKEALKDNVDVIAVMAGDAQMDPAILHKIIEPVVRDKADYAKGDRFSIPGYRQGMPRFRAFGSLLLTYLTRIASGYWHIYDSQNGYTAISTGTLRKLDLDKIEPDFAFENDMLVKLNVIGARVVNVPHTAVYGGQKSKIRYHRFVPKTSWLLLKDFLWRLGTKYLVAGGRAGSQRYPPPSDSPEQPTK